MRQRWKMRDCSARRGDFVTQHAELLCTLSVCPFWQGRTALRGGVFVGVAVPELSRVYFSGFSGFYRSH